jgi:hypothetical protein
VFNVSSSESSWSFGCGGQELFPLTDDVLDTEAINQRSPALGGNLLAKA